MLGIGEKNIDLNGYPVCEGNLLLHVYSRGNTLQDRKRVSMPPPLRCKLSSGTASESKAAVISLQHPRLSDHNHSAWARSVCW